MAAPAVRVHRTTTGSRYNPRNDMAIDSTPDRSLSDLLKSSRAALAMTGCGPASIDRSGSERNPATPARVLSFSAWRTWRTWRTWRIAPSVTGLLPVVALFQRSCPRRCRHPLPHRAAGAYPRGSGATCPGRSQGTEMVPEIALDGTRPPPPDRARLPPSYGSAYLAKAISERIWVRIFRELRTNRQRTGQEFGSIGAAREC